MKKSSDRPPERSRFDSRPLRILRLDASASDENSTSRRLGDYLVDRLVAGGETIELRRRDLNREARFIDGAWIAASSTIADSRDAGQAARLEHSDLLVGDLRWADRVVLTTPMYNFGVPATLKAWIDHVCRAGVTFRYTAEGPLGLLRDKQADIVVTTGGAPLGSPVDFVSGYLRQVFTFIGFEDVHVIGADRMNVDAEASLAGARAQIDARFPGTREEVAA